MSCVPLCTSVWCIYVGGDHCPFVTEESLAAHMRGRGHQITLDRQREAARNVFVRGFPKHTTVTSDLLKELFQQYGEVEGVFLKVLLH